MPTQEAALPTYQYSCTKCGHFFEQFQSFSEDSLTVCPECQGRLRKVFNAVGVVFKGSGFYRTDSRAATSGSDGAKSSGGDKSPDKAPGKGADKSPAKTSAKESAPSSSGSSGASTTSSGSAA